MDKSLRTLTASISLISAVCMSSSILPDVAGAVVTPPKTKCFIEVQNAHISTSILEQQGRLAVKVNATSRCNVPQSNVTLTVKIFKEGLGVAHLVAQRSTRADNPKSQGLVVKINSLSLTARTQQALSTTGWLQPARQFVERPIQPRQSGLRKLLSSTVAPELDFIHE